jgi:hypothetical protein
MRAKCCSSVITLQMTVMGLIQIQITLDRQQAAQQEVLEHGDLMFRTQVVHLNTKLVPSSSFENSRSPTPHSGK